MEIIQQAIKKLANSMRMYGEVCFDFQRLVKIDKEEAIDNLDRAFEAKLEAFHSLYDVTKNDIDYFANGDTAALILMRNAIHHRDHLLFKSWNQVMALDDGYKNHYGAEFLLVAFEILGSPPRQRYYYKLEDFYLRIDEKLDSPYLEQRMKNASREKMISQFDTELNFAEVKSYASQERYPVNQIYINVIPIFVSAVCRVFTALRGNGVDFVGFDANAYKEPFTNELSVDFSKIIYTPLRIT